MADNPLPCGCAVVGTQHIDSITGHIHYLDMHVKHCDMHASVTAAEIARLQAIEVAARGLVKYRKRNTINFQLEKADDYINEMRNNLEAK